MAGKDYPIEGGYTSEDDKKLATDIADQILAGMGGKGKSKPITIKVGEFSKDFTKEFDKVDKIIAKRVKEIQKKVQNYTSNIKPDISGIKVFPKNQDKIDDAVSRARKKYGLSLNQEDSFEKQYTEHFKILGRLSEVKESRKAVKGIWDEEKTIATARTTIDLLKEQIDLEKKLLEINRQVNKYLPKSERVSDISEFEIENSEALLKQTPNALGTELLKQTEAAKKSIRKALSEYEKSSNELIAKGQFPENFEMPDLSQKFIEAEQAASEYLKTLGLIKEKSSAKELDVKRADKLLKENSNVDSLYKEISDIEAAASIAKDYFGALPADTQKRLGELTAIIEHLTQGNIASLPINEDGYNPVQAALDEIKSMDDTNPIFKTYQKISDALKVLGSSATEANGPVNDIKESLNSVEPNGNTEGQIKSTTEAFKELTAAEKEEAQVNPGGTGNVETSVNGISEIDKKTEAIEKLTEAKKEQNLVDQAKSKVDESRTNNIKEINQETSSLNELTEAKKEQKKIETPPTKSGLSNTSVPGAGSNSLEAEIDSAQKLAKVVSDITNNVEEKTNAFKTEQAIVTPILEGETSSAKSLSDQISLVKDSVESISSIKTSSKNPLEKIDSGVNSIDLERLEKLAGLSERLSASLSGIDTVKLPTAGRTGIVSDSDASAESAERVAKLNAEALKSKQSAAQLEAQTLAAEEKAYQEMERHEKAKIEREKAALSLAEQKRKIEAAAVAEQEKQRQIAIQSSEAEKSKAAELALQKELLYLDQQQAEYERLRSQYAKEGIDQAKSITAAIRNQEKAYNDMWLAAEKDSDKVWSYSQKKYKSAKTGGETGFFVDKPTNLDELQKAMRGLAMATSGILPESIKFNEQTKRMGFEAKNAAGDIQKYTVSLNHGSNELLLFQTQTVQAKSATQEFTNFVGTSAKKVLSYVFSFGSFYALWARLREGVGIIKEIDDSMTELKKVSDETAVTYEKFQKQAGEAGRKVAQSTSDMIQASADWKKMGYDLQESLTLASASSLYVNVGDNIDMAESTSDLISIMKAFKKNANDAIGIVDRLNAVSNNFAVTSKDLGNILNHSSSSLAAANTSLDKTIAMGAAMNEVLQDSSIAGSTLKVLSMRLRGAKVDLEAAGESTEGMAASTSKLRDKILALTNVDGTGGFDIMKDENTFKDIYDQMDGIAAKWKQMDDISRAGLLELIAGKNRAQGVSALLNNWSEAEAILQTSLTATGSAEAENEKYLESISGKVNQLKAQYQELWQATIDDDKIKFFVDLATSVTKLATDIGGLIPVVISLGAAFAGIKFAGKIFRLRDNECALLINAA